MDATEKMDSSALSILKERLAKSEKFTEIEQKDSTLDVTREFTIWKLKATIQKNGIIEEIRSSYSTVGCIILIVLFPASLLWFGLYVSWRRGKRISEFLDDLNAVLKTDYKSDDYVEGRGFFTTPYKLKDNLDKNK
jgi:hypothetical protein